MAYVHLDNLDEDDQEAHAPAKAPVLLTIHQTMVRVPGLDGTLCVRAVDELHGLQRYLQRHFDAMLNSEAAECLEANSKAAGATHTLHVMVPNAVYQAVFD